MNIIVFLITLFFLIVFFKPKYKLLFAFIIMTDGFDVLPAEINGIKLWDVGFFMFIYCFIQEFLKTRIIRIPVNPIMKAVGLFLLYLIFEFFMSILYFQYPFVKTIQASRQMILGYTLPFIFFYLFSNNIDTYENFMGLLYKTVYLATLIHILQFLINKPLLFGYQGDYSGMMRSIPVFISLTSLFLWKNLSDFYSGIKLNTQDKFFIVLSVVSLVLTFTRGLYLSLIICFLVFLLIKIIQKRLKLNRIAMTLFALIFFITAFGSFIPDTVIDRFTDSFTTLQKGSSYYSDKDNNFTFRLLLLEERINMVADSNPLFGFGFIHEDIAKQQLKWSIGTGSSENSIGFGTADIAWANIVIYTGFLGCTLFIVFIVIFLFSFPIRAGNYLIFMKGKTRCSLCIITYYIQIIQMIILMFNSSLFTSNLNLISIILIGYIVRQNEIYSYLQKQKNGTLVLQG